MKALDDNTIASLLEPTPITPTRVNTQKGPVRFYDQVMRCASRMCSSPTYIKIDGIPRCYAHAIIDLNQIVLNLEGHGIYNRKEGTGLDDLPGSL